MTSPALLSGVPPVRLAPYPATLVELLAWRAASEPGRTAYVFLPGGEEAEEVLSFGELDQRARAIAATLQECCAPGARALLLYPSGLEYMAAFFGCLYAGVVAVPAYPPRPNRADPRIRAIVADSGPAVVLAGSDTIAQVARHFGDAPELAALRWIDTGSLASDADAGWREPGLRADTLAFLQYTSGSTAAPRGVMVTHANLLHNCWMVERACEHPPTATCVSWLPLYHDMGLIGTALQTLFLGAPCVLMPAAAFLQRPMRWLRAVSRYRAQSSGGPNFAYELCVARTTPEQRAELDLSAWDFAFTGAEPVRADTLDRFARAFEPAGFRRDAFYPCYGLAEATVFGTGGTRAAPPVVRAFRAEALQAGRVAEAEPGEEGARMLVGCGRPWLGQQVRIVDPAARTPCAPGQIGEIWLSGAGVAAGYWGRPEASAEVFAASLAGGEGPYLRTGDLGFVHEGELFVAGRIKDLIVIRGRNHYPQDVEATVERSHAALRPGCTAAFAVEADGDERLVVACEVERSHLGDSRAEVERAIRRAVAEEHDLRVHAVVVLRPGAIPRTSSGKVRRHACQAAFEAGTLGAGPHA